MSHFPLFVDLTAETVLLIGEVSEEKERLLASFGCRTRRCAVLTEELLDSLTPALVVIGQGDKRNETWAALCRARGILVNVVDTPALCSFYFPAIVRRGELTAAVSTSGKSPAMAAAVKERIDSLLPQDLGENLDALSRRRGELSHLSAHERREVLRAMAKDALK
ncbi:MAG: bifunctional precorrin-2 dehydrogenase/sirohydrochlorin ferrochelatase [Oscillospiraceae bacterium]|nr:bifunctional precorrin-2 dehydrogenase/sirohydrochlorin ferrochelatase [Oscillospiraceae bacterium]